MSEENLRAEIAKLEADKALISQTAANYLTAIGELEEVLRVIANGEAYSADDLRRIAADKLAEDGEDENEQAGKEAYSGLDLK